MSSRAKINAEPLARMLGELVAIVGRPNVGKSALFNRLTRSRRSIVTDEPGITRDRIYGRATWGGKTFEVVDTGGLLPDEEAALAPEIFRQAGHAIEAAARIVLVVDVRAGLTPLDAELARRLRKTGKPLVVAANKVDTARTEPEALAFHRLGIEPVIPVSAEHGLGIDDLLEELTRGLEAGERPAAPVTLNVALIGRPNVGKSTLLNKLAGSERAIVAPEPGTTRDAVDTLVAVEAGWWRLIDTAGIRRKGKTELFAEKLSVVMARKHLERADVAVLLIDASEGVTHQDAAIGGYASASGGAVVLAANKWDAVEKDTHTMASFTSSVRRRMKFLDYAPLVFISALTGQRLGRLRQLISEVAAARLQRVPPAELKTFLRELRVERATVPGGRTPQIHSLEQIGIAPPSFVLHANFARLHFAFARFFENQLRARFNFSGTPLRLRLARPGGRRNRG